MSSDNQPDAASILFPNETPAPSKAPEWFKNERTQAVARLSGLQKLNQSETPEKASAPDAASILFPSEKPVAQGEKPAAGDATEKKSDFPDDPAKGYEKAGSGFDALRLDAISDGEKERAEDLRVARDGLIANARDAGTPPEALEDAINVVRERAGEAYMNPPTEETLAADMATGLDVLRNELGESFEADISMARRLIADVEKIAPGTIDSLINTGAGNDLRLIRSVIREAKRRGYR